MAFLHNEGELLVLDSAFSGRDVEVGLFNDDIDELEESDDYSGITTEPDGENYESQIVTNPDVSANGGDTEVTLGAISYNVSDATSEINYSYVRDAVSGDLIFTSELEQVYDLNSVDTIDLDNVGFGVE